MYTYHWSYFFVALSIFLYPSKNIIAQSNDLEYYYQQGLKYELDHLDTALYYFTKVDSLAYEKVDSHMISESAIFLSGYYKFKGNIIKSNRYINSALPFALTTIDSINLLSTLTSSIKVYDPATSDSLFQLAIDLAIKVTSEELPSLYNNYAHLLHRKGDLGKAAMYFQQAAGLVTNDYTKLQVYNSLLNIFEALGNKPLIKEYLDKAIILAEKNNYKSRNGVTALHLAKYLTSVNQFDEAKLELDKAIAYESKLRPGPFEISKVITLFQYYSATEEWDSLQRYLDRRQSTFEKYKIEKHPTILISRARCAYENKDYLQSETLALQTLGEAQNKNIKSGELKATELLALIYTAQNNLKKAVEFQALSKKMSDKYYHNTQTQNIIYLEAEFNRKEQQQAIELLNQENLVNEITLERKNKYLKIGALVLSLFALLLFFLYRLYKKVNHQKSIISKSLKEKDLLLREIHHRVKNNLQLVSSLLTMQGRSINDETAIQAINEGKSRVRSMALIHQDLYSKENLTEISVKSYIEKLTLELFSTYRIDEDKINLKMNVQDIEMDIDTLVPLGLIINELITNSLKYAWPNKTRGTLHIALVRNTKQIILVVKDDGIGYDPTSIREDSFGATLISALTLQLDGECQVTTKNGTTVQITIETNDMSA